ncbi:MAG TPA: type II toxin-antitoxin system VapB family antitoxin [Chloroflexota bacterium]|nr:type II toxin-antitoxin system VapB family antitoxin [Chloroflexota bacterium]
MRTTINVDDQLLADAKRLAQESGKTLTAVIEDALRERLARREPAGQRHHSFRLHTYGGNGLQPGVDLDNSAGLRDLMDDLA